MNKKKDATQNKEVDDLKDDLKTEENIENKVDTEDVVEETAAEEKSPIEELELQKAELQDKYLRLMAEFTNYKKRAVREKLDMMNTAAQDTLSAILPVADDFDRAKKTAEDDSTTEQFSEGVQLVYNKLKNILSQKGLKEMETDGVAFDPDLHEALTEIPAPSEDMKGKIIDTIEKGYFLNDKLIRHAKVVVGK